mgnify:FL=1
MKKRIFSYLYYTSYLLNTQGLFTKIEIFSILVIKQPIRNIYNPNPLILAFIMPGTGEYHFG